MFPERKLPVTLDGAYELESVVGSGGMAVVYGAGVDLERFDLALVVAFREAARGAQGQEALQRRKERYRQWRGRPREELIAICERKGLPYPREGRAAIKVLAPHFGLKRKIRARFQAEWMSMMAIGSPHLVQVYGGGYDKQHEVYYYAMELLPELVRLSEIIQLPVASKLTLVAQAAAGVGALHRRGIIHRDLKPENVLVARIDGALTAKVCDLGVAKTGAAEGLTSSGAMFGTPQYMAPEALGATRDASVASDVYSLGATLYHLLTGKAPYQGLNQFEMMGRLYNGVPPESILTLSDGHVPEAVEALVLEMMAREPERRPPSTAAVVTRIGEVLRELPPELRDAAGLSMPQPRLRTSPSQADTELRSEEPLTPVGGGELVQPTQRRQRVGGSMALMLHASVTQKRRSERQPNFVISDQHGNRAELELDVPEFAIGRSSLCALKIADPKLSKVHCRFVRTDEGWELIDEKSTNGTFLGGQQVRRAQLQPGDVVSLGGLEVRWQPEEEALMALILDDEDEGLTTDVTAESALEATALDHRRVGAEELDDLGSLDELELPDDLDELDALEDLSDLEDLLDEDDPRARRSDIEALEVLDSIDEVEAVGAVDSLDDADAVDVLDSIDDVDVLESIDDLDALEDELTAQEQRPALPAEAASPLAEESFGELEALTTEAFEARTAAELEEARPAPPAAPVELVPLPEDSFGELEALTAEALGAGTARTAAELDDDIEELDDDDIEELDDDIEELDDDIEELDDDDIEELDDDIEELDDDDIEELDDDDIEELDDDDIEELDDDDIEEIDDDDIEEIDDDDIEEIDDDIEEIDDDIEEIDDDIEEIDDDIEEIEDDDIDEIESKPRQPRETVLSGPSQR